MTLFDLILMMVIVVVGLQFWRIRAISEKAHVYLEQYCQQQGLQLISLSRVKTRLTSIRGKLDWHSEFTFEFSGNGEDAYQGKLIMGGLKVLQTDLPPYRV
ncbi:DUF3301 domain-containing protein [Aliiglaciecola sp. CAU 1673]|uniref:DUF3301 domain-containing protein n=1 Tax=Aliiglaciecola sp. CAU 1673 TaxID=3032595 RepID=UPI0023DA2D4A|nr:DUF3301 domain-containing protein [Aliiglaciecola sp. CAU 1673]MDF2179633.1 DUF3301 domain-containing protein [Aliiglaciecola sp. CAU 1673]